MWINYQLMAVCPLILKFLRISSQNGLFLLIILASQTFYPNCQIFVHGYIAEIYMYGRPLMMDFGDLVAGIDVRVKTCGFQVAAHAAHPLIDAVHIVTHRV